MQGCLLRCSATHMLTPRRWKRSSARRTAAESRSYGRSGPWVGVARSGARRAADAQRCTVALVGNHDYGAAGAVDLVRLGEARSPGLRSLELARERLSGADLESL